MKNWLFKKGKNPLSWPYGENSVERSISIFLRSLAGLSSEQDSLRVNPKLATRKISDSIGSGSVPGRILISFFSAILKCDGRSVMLGRPPFSPRKKSDFLAASNKFFKIKPLLPNHFPNPQGTTGMASCFFTSLIRSIIGTPDLKRREVNRAKTSRCSAVSTWRPATITSFFEFSASGSQ